MIPALLPVKELRGTKTRLAVDLPRDAVERLTLAMLQDLIDCLASVARVDRVAVVTPDREVARHAERAGAVAMLRDDPGLNPSLDAAAAGLRAEGAEGVLVVLGDVAGAVPADIESMFDALEDAGGRGVVLAPSSDGGTSALLRVPGDAIANAFGRESARRHRELAEDAGVPYRELELPSLAVDLDHLSDVPALLGAPGAKRTRALLLELGLGEPR